MYILYRCYVARSLPYENSTSFAAVLDLADSLDSGLCSLLGILLVDWLVKCMVFELIDAVYLTCF